ncbi:MAG: hypothetical protein AB7S50_13055 [Bacteroidales bacterium]
MKHLIFFFVIFLLTHSCSNKNSSNNETSNSKNELAIDYNNKVERGFDSKFYKCDSLIAAIDTIAVDSFRLIIMRIERTEFETLITNNSTLKYEETHSINYEEKTDSRVNRLNDTTLIYSLKNNKTDTLKNVYSQQVGGGYASFKYCGFLKSINAFLITGSYEETTDLILIDCSNGEKKHISNNLVISPEEIRMVSYDWDGWAFKSGGFKFYNISGNNIKLLLSYSQPEINAEKIGFYWSLSNVYIINNSEIIFVHQFYVKNPVQILKCFSRLKIEKQQHPTRG